MRIRALVFAAALAACGQSAEKGSETPAASAQTDPFDLHIEIGRYGVMLSQVQSLTRERPGSAEADPSAPGELARNLRETVWEYNLIRSQLCAKGLFTEVACGPAYEPVWISEPANAAPTLAEIEARADAVGEETMRLWNVVCEDARARETDEQERMYVCAIE